MILILGFLAIALCAVNAYIPMGPYKQQILNIHNDVRRMEPAANMQMMVGYFYHLIKKKRTCAFIKS